MARTPLWEKNTPIVYHAKRNNLDLIDLARALNCTLPTIKDYIENPRMMRLRDLMILGGLFGMKATELLYLIERNKASYEYNNKKGQFHLSEIMRKVEEDELRYRKQKDQG